MSSLARGTRWTAMDAAHQPSISMAADMAQAGKANAAKGILSGAQGPVDVLLPGAAAALEPTTVRVEGIVVLREDVHGTPRDLAFAAAREDVEISTATLPTGSACACPPTRARTPPSAR